MSTPRAPLPRWIKVLAWLGAWAGVVAIAQFVPLGVSIGLAVALFAVQILVAAGGSACHLPPQRGREVKNRHATRLSPNPAGAPPAA